MNRTPTLVIAAGAALALVVGACGSNDDESGSGGTATQVASTLPTGSQHVELNPADFTTNITNPYWPMKVGSKWVYKENGSQVVVTVTDKTKKIANGVTARVVHDVVSENGEPIEVTDDWYAQDKEGNIWYLGEKTAEYKNGKVVTRAGSFNAGKDGAEAGIIMPAKPEVGQTYRQEYYAGEAEDFASVLSLDATAKVPFGSYTGCLQTKDVNPLDKPQQVEHKFFCKGVGPVKVVTVAPEKGGGEDLVSFTQG
jgi:hypothetical protein